MADKMNLVSIIVPVYNVESYLHPCLDSIIHQSYKNIEIILVNDGSTDKSGLICDEYSKIDARIRVIHKPNGGSNSARNAGLDASSGEYIAFVDSDDYISKNTFRAQTTSLEQSHADIAVCGCSIYSTERKCFSSVDRYDEGERFCGKEAVLKFIIPLKCSVCNKLFRRNTIKDTRFLEGMVKNEDLLFLSEILTLRTVISTTSENGYYYEKRDNSITSSNFSDTSFLEIESKDKSYCILVNKFPELKDALLVIPFRGRQNLLRELHANQSKRFRRIADEYTNWCNTHYVHVKSLLPIRKRIEYFIYQHAKFLYLILLKLKSNVKS